ncbi:FMN-binding protein [Micromonospora rifamycinica]|uniref:FMN-binding domain-containing protein n=1 Tax=Micromonospora rifamycinica TaxID=291594 RepID=A0A109IGS0_9ACTN|nr:FMN-binding protein [Micromonospora rifamycinica]KWV30241.1 FMN-binding protein [Micromonospora rifamycinica]SCG80875.1 FMN-binding domain-containing protein [Micromonospora rifamycinica]
MRRALLAITGLAAGTTALVVLKGAPGTGQAHQGLPATTPAGTPARSGPATTGPATTDATPQRATATSRPTGRPGATPSRTPGGTRSTPGGTPPAPRAGSAAPPSATRRVTGPVISTEYGNVQVRITVSGTRIVDAVAVELPQGGQSDLRSARVDDAYSGTSGAVVRQQSALLDTVSQATATSDGYRRSLQAALDRARG